MQKVAIISGTPENWREFETTAACDEMYERTVKTLRKLAEGKEALRVVTTMNLGPEILAAEAALRLRGEYSIELECVIPYEEQAKGWTEPERDRYFSIIENCDKETLISTAYTDSCELKSYEHIINTADIVLLGTAPTEETTEIIKSSGKKIINI